AAVGGGDRAADRAGQRRRGVGSVGGRCLAQRRHPGRHLRRRGQLATGRMSAPATGTGGLLLVHAHPDDESITTGGTIAHYRRRGIPVTVVTCTLGEEGEVIGEQWAQLTAD